MSTETLIARILALYKPDDSAKNGGTRWRDQSGGSEPCISCALWLHQTAGVVCACANTGDATCQMCRSRGVKCRKVSVRRPFAEALD